MLIQARTRREIRNFGLSTPSLLVKSFSVKSQSNSKVLWHWLPPVTTLWLAAWLAAITNSAKSKRPLAASEFPESNRNAKKNASTALSLSPFRAKRCPTSTARRAPSTGRPAWPSCCAHGNKSPLRRWRYVSFRVSLLIKSGGICLSSSKLTFRNNSSRLEESVLHAEFAVVRTVPPPKESTSKILQWSCSSKALRMSVSEAHTLYALTSKRNRSFSSPWRAANSRNIRPDDAGGQATWSAILILYLKKRFAKSIASARLLRNLWACSSTW